MRPVLGGIAFVLVFDAVTIRVFGTRELPGEDIGAIRRVCDCRRISSKRRFRAVETLQTILAVNIPVAVGRVAYMLNPGEQPLGARAVGDSAGIRATYRHKVLRAGEDEHIAPLV